MSCTATAVRSVAERLKRAPNCWGWRILCFIATQASLLATRRSIPFPSTVTTPIPQRAYDPCGQQLLCCTDQKRAAVALLRGCKVGSQIHRQRLNSSRTRFCRGITWKLQIATAGRYEIYLGG